jgi:hypothetical protein
VYARLQEAILTRRELSLYYARDGSAEGERVVAPHALFRSSDGRLFLHAYQATGVSTRGELPDWRRFALESIVGAALLDSPFVLRSDYDPSSKAYSAGLLVSVA